MKRVIVLIRHSRGGFTLYLSNSIYSMYYIKYQIYFHESESIYLRIWHIIVEKLHLRGKIEKHIWNYWSKISLNYLLNLKQQNCHGQCSNLSTPIEFNVRAIKFYSKVKYIISLYTALWLIIMIRIYFRNNK